MALPLWGQLDKAQDDDETILEAIARLIADHEADSTAHLGSGESLESHKTEGVLDHPAGSILADKNTMTELSIRTIFETLSAWSTVGSVSNNDIPGLELYVETGAVSVSEISNQPQSPSPFRTSTKNILFQIFARSDLNGTGYLANFGIFNGSGLTPTGFGFIVDGGTVYAYAKSGTDIKQSSALSVTFTNDNTYRAYLDAGLGKIKYYINGSLVATLDVPSPDWNDDGGVQIRVEDDGGVDGDFIIGELYYSREL